MSGNGATDGPYRTRLPSAQLASRTAPPPSRPRPKAVRPSSPRPAASATAFEGVAEPDDGPGKDPLGAALADAESSRDLGIGKAKTGSKPENVALKLCQ